VATLNFGQIEDLWTSNGGNPVAAPVMAAIALAETGGSGSTTAHNPKPPDDSYGLWQINYYGPLARSRTANYGTPTQLLADPNLQAKAAIAISGNGTNLNPWTTYTSGAYKKYLGGQLPPIGSIPGVASSPGVQLQSTTLGVQDKEGKITMPSFIPNIPRAGIRRVVGAGVIVTGGVVGLAGLFLLTGRRAPGPSRIVTQVIQSRTSRANAQTAQEGLLQRSQERETRRRQRESESVSSPVGSEEPF